MTPSDQTFQRDVKRTLLRYTFGPVLLLVALFFALVGASWSYYVVMRSDEVRHLAVEVLDETIADYSSRTDLAASQNYDPDILRTNASARAAVFQYLYHEVNIDKRGTQFFLLDKKKQLVLGSEKTLPPALTDVPEGWASSHASKHIREPYTSNFCEERPMRLPHKISSSGSPCRMEMDIFSF